jgi:uncharacterized protein YfaS (alpha-2-macroglobulin family)
LFYFVFISVIKQLFMRKLFLLVLLSAIVLVFPTLAQNKKMKNPYEEQWRKADSLMNMDLPASAAGIARQILADAKSKKDNPNYIKAQLFLMNTKEDTDENAGINFIKEAEAEIAKNQGAEKAIWQSITARMYWNYFEQNRWKFYDRTALSGIQQEDIATWDAPAFFSRITALFQASISEREILRGIPVERYAPILEEGVNTRNLRPTLYDLLVNRAISFFENDEKDIINPAFKFTMDDEKWFAPASVFQQTRPDTKDTSSLHALALTLYQELLAFHAKDSKPDAFIDADLQRLNFVYQNSVHPRKDSLYIKALQQLEQQYAGRPEVSEVSFRLVVQQMGDAAVRPYPGKGGNTAVKKNRDLPGAIAKLKNIVSRYPGTEGAVNAGNLLRTLEQTTLQVQAEEVVIPAENSKVLITYKNAGTVYLKLYKIPHEQVRGNYNYGDNETLLKNITAMKPVRAWEQSLPGNEDMEEHNTEVKIDALPGGAYILLVATKNDLLADNNVSMARFQVSGTSFIMNSGDREGYALDRKTGYPLKNVKVKFWSQEYSNKTKGYELRSLGDDITDASGRVSVLYGNANSYDNRLNTITLVNGKDTLWVGGYFNSYDYYRGNENAASTQTFFFTDRSLYRPGQTIYFKGIKLTSSGKGKNEVRANIPVTVFLYDANGQKAQSLQLTTNEFGSFTGKFTAPEGLLNGEMRIACDDGSVYFSVEEYKRPKFYVDYDTLKGNYALNKTVKVKGFAKAYAGNNIDGAEVKYRVVRRARFPYYWCFYRWGAPSSPEMEIANGTAMTAEDGSFEVSFTTIPDKSVDPQTLPVFTYTVYADVTDINGETRSGTLAVNAGYRSLQINAGIAEESKPRELKELFITTRNLNDVFVPAKVNIAIARLKSPAKVLRKRLWAMPDQFTMKESEFRAAFPDDEYKEEGNYLNWEKGETIHQQSWTTTAEGKVKIPEATWYKNGWYLIEISTKDAEGNEILEKKYTYVWAPGKKEAEQKDFVTYTEQDSYEPGETVELWYASGADNPYLLTKAVKPSGAFQVEKDKRPLSFKITEADRGGIAFSWLYVHNSRVYTATRTINIPWSNKDLQLEWGTHRDKLLPGSGEEWTLTIKGDKKEKVAAELLAGMYDASLDAFRGHSWSWSKLTPGVYAQDNWSRYGFGIASGHVLKYIEAGPFVGYEKRYDDIIAVGPNGQLDFARRGGHGRERVYYKNAEIATDALQSAAPAAPVAMEQRKEESESQDKPVAGSKDADKATQQAEPQVRKNLQETAFFFPDLKTDAEGNIRVKFTMPEALTEWKFMAFAHTKDWKTGYLEGKVKTQKDLMVMPNLPRFLRQGDDMVISSKISNLSEGSLTGTATLEVLNAQTMQPLDLPFRLQQKEQQFSAGKGQSAAVNWSIHVPESIYTPVVFRIIAKSGAFSDGEENVLPVISNRVLVTETLPLPVRGGGERTFALEKLLRQTSNTISHHALTVEFTGNPAWYAVQALPYLMEYPYECAEQTFNRFYANALAAHIVAGSPKVAAIFNQWKTKDTAALLSNLEKNQELKTALLEETPWVMEAKNETEQKHRIALLFETHKLSKELEGSLRKLEQMQLSEGGFPWFKGMRSDRYITQYIITGIGRLQQLNVGAASNKSINRMLAKALPYLDRELQREYDELLKNKVDINEQRIGYTQIQYLYMRSFFTKGMPVPATTQKAYDYYKKQAAKYWSRFSPYMKGMIAIGLHNAKDKTVPAQIMASLKETAIHNDEMGMYWKNMPEGYWWYEAPIEAQALLIEAFRSVAGDNVSVDAMKVWLIKQKQTQNWKTTKATADACYALLLSGTDWLAETPEVTIKLGSETIRSAETKTEAGTGYFKKRFEGPAVKPEMGNISVNVGRSKSEGVSWGAVYWQYFEDMDKITSAATPLSLRKQLFIERNTDRGPVLTEIKDGNELKVGDKVKVRIELRADRDMEYVQLKDMRAACFEPLNVISQYKYQGGLGYYESTRDVSTSFFFDYLRKGTYVFEYPVFVTASGNFSNGIATIQCMYAPEFSSHSEGIRVKVR